MVAKGDLRMARNPRCEHKKGGRKFPSALPTTRPPENYSSKVRIFHQPTSIRPKVPATSSSGEAGVGADASGNVNAHALEQAFPTPAGTCDSPENDVMISPAASRLKKGANSIRSDTDPLCHADTQSRPSPTATPRIMDEALCACPSTADKISPSTMTKAKYLALDFNWGRISFLFIFLIKRPLVGCED